MKGLIYKNIILNKLYFIISAAVPTLFGMFLILALCLSGDDAKAELESLSDGSMILMLFILFGVFIAFMTQSNTIGCDETKKWAYFITSSPRGVKGQVLSQYFSIFILSFITAASSLVAELFAAVIVKVSTGENFEIDLRIIAGLFFVMVFLNALELPFLFRFGSKRGAFVKMIMGLILIIAIMIYLLFGPLPDDMDSFMEAVIKAVDEFRHGRTPKVVKIICRAFPFVSLGAYAGSYFISCKFYLKGVENYDK